VSDGIYLLDLDAPIHPYLLRTGLLCPEPGFTYSNTSGALHSSVPPDDGPWSPPGINLLFYADVSPQERFAELEHLGPLRVVAPGESVSLVQTIRLTTATECAEPVRSSAFRRFLARTGRLKAGLRTRGGLHAPAGTKRLRLAYAAGEGVETGPDGGFLAWTAPLQDVPVSLRPLDPNRPPEVVGKALLFAGSPLEIPRLAPLQAAGPGAPRAVEILFQPQDHPGKSPQMLFEIGGSGNGYNLWLENGAIQAGVWGKDASGTVTACFMEAPMPEGIATARLEIDLLQGEAHLLINGEPRASTSSPRIQPHRDRCALGGIAGASRLPYGVVRSGTAPFYGEIRRLTLEMPAGTEVW
jgi:hypothetical protein